jgi:hypothetical protein
VFTTDPELSRRELLHLLLKAQSGLSAVYFQPPSNDKMEYPAIVYQRDAADTNFADNNPYMITKRYQVTVIDYDPDSMIPDRIAALPQCVFERHFNADGLNHDVYTLYF